MYKFGPTGPPVEFWLAELILTCFPFLGPILILIGLRMIVVSFRKNQTLDRRGKILIYLGAGMALVSAIADKFFFISFFGR